MEPMSPVKSKKSEIKRLISENQRKIIFPTVLAIVVSLVLLDLFVFGLVPVYEKEPMLPSLIEAEATILGFFGLIVVYVLSSLDSKIDRVEQRLHTRIREPLEKYKDLGGVLKTILTERLRNIEEKKRETVRSALFIGVYMIASLMLAIWALGIPLKHNDLSFVLSSYSLMFLFVSISGFLWILYSLGKSPEVIISE